jgi:hypothetical protein
MLRSDCTDVSGLIVVLIFKGQAVQEDWTPWPLKMGLLGHAETSVGTTQHCVTSQKSDNLNNIKAEA